MAIVRTTSGITDISQLRGRKACFGQVGDTVTWDLVASYLAKQTGQLQTPQCHESYMDSMMKYFGDMCAPYDSRNYTQEESRFIRTTLCRANEQRFNQKRLFDTFVGKSQRSTVYIHK